jgi:hypothetical protein
MQEDGARIARQVVRRAVARPLAGQRKEKKGEAERNEC